MLFCVTAEESEEVYQLTDVDFTLVTGSRKYICGNSVQSYALCVECYDRHASEGRQKHSHLQRRKDDISDLQEKSVAYARLLSLAPDLLSCSEPLHELGTFHPCLFLSIGRYR